MRFLDKLKSAKSWYNKGTKLLIQGNYKEALKCFNKAVEVDPEYDFAWNSKGLIHEKFEEYQNALESFNKALEIQSKICNGLD